MPELPEVQTIVTMLASRLAGRRILGLRHLRPDIVKPPGTDLAGHLCSRTIASVDRRAKRVVVSLDDATRFFIHLGMSGRLTLEAPSAPLAPHTHMVVALDDGRELRFRDPRRFGGVFWLGCAAGDGDLGPEPLTLRAGPFASRLSRTRRAIKAALLDQRLIAGLGNIYVDESLHAAGIHPLTPARRLAGDQVRSLLLAIKATLRRAIRHRGSTLRDYVDASGSAGAFQSLHRVYGRAGQPCPVCAAAIARIVIAGRSTHLCRTCQPRGRLASQRRG